MVMDLIIPGLAVLGISGAVGAVVHYINNKRMEEAMEEMTDTQDMRDKRIRDAIKETLVNDLDKVRAEGIKIKDTVDDSITKMKKLEVERNHFKKEVADLLRMQLKQELSSRIRDAMGRLNQVSDEQKRLEDMLDGTKKDVKGGVLQINNKISSLKDDSRKVEDKFVQIKGMVDRVSSRKGEIEEDILQSLRKKGLKDINTRIQELGTQVKLTKKVITQVEEDRDTLMNKMKSLDLETNQGLKLTKNEVLKQLKKVRELTKKEDKELKKELDKVKKENNKLLIEIRKLNKSKPKAKMKKKATKKKVKKKKPKKRAKKK
jgi:chromosome segregation ATPase